MNSADPLADQLQAGLAPGFRVLRLLGQGAVARVYLATETALERLVAIKVLRPELAADVATRRRFAREARSTARIVHPNVAAVHRVGEMADGAPYMVREYVEGRTLADALAGEGPTDPASARRVLAQIAGALAAAHERGIIHRDVRPGNILVERGTGRVVLTDFGLARIVESGSGRTTRITRVGEVLGNPRYASPEQLLGEPTTVETDIYSLGVVAYEVLTGEGPYAGRTTADILTAHVKGLPRDLLELRPDAGAELARLLGRCLAKNPAHRPSAAELAAAFAGAPAAAAAPEDDVPAAPLPTFLRELHRRRVYRTGAAYLAGAFALLQGADLVLRALPVPSCSYNVLAIAVLAAFPLVLVLAWGFDITRGGIRRTRAHPATQSAAGGRVVYLGLRAAGLVVSLLLAALVGWWLLR